MRTKQLAQKIIEQAQQNPARAAHVYRRGASVLGYAASLPENAAVALQLEALGFDFVDAALQSRAGGSYDFGGLFRRIDDVDVNLPAANAPEAPPPSPSYGGGGASLADLNDLQVSTQPKSFNQTTTLGRVANVTFNPSSDQRVIGIAQTQTVAFWQGNKVEAQAMSVDIGTVLPPAPNAFLTQSARTFALVEWGCDGYRQALVEVDVGLGRRLSIPANYIAVSVGMDPPRTGTVTPTLAIGGSISTFAAPSQAPVIRTRYFDFLTPGGASPRTLIPLRAVQLLTPMSSIIGVTITINWYDYGGANMGVWTWNNAANIPNISPTPVPPDAYFFDISSTGGSSLRVPFQLSL